MKLKKTTAAILVAGLTVAGSSLAFANDTIFKADEEKEEISAEVTTAADIQPGVIMDPSEVLKDSTQKDDSTNDETLEVTTKDDSTKDDSTEEATEDNKETDVVKETDKEDEDHKNETSKSEFPEIPEGYTAGNLVALKQAYENAGNENAKQAILNNAKRAIAKFKEKHDSKEVADLKVKLELVGIQKPGETIIEPVKQETVIPSQETTKTENEIISKEEQKIEKKELKEQQKAEKKELKEQQKAEKKELKEQQKAEKKAAKAEKNNGKDKE
ncbi:DUF2756 domain-containing protein [Ureibacillus acetophenoni]|uniref:Uncharacterized protein DUF2756 n=1 Tax=Ureibacillus acetophenoni TaxID=614649 RepID=A0A285U631_9BACL|nr:DUF2756 domain-containing protein [Ureibacillus acetophenoni]SOC37385.1 uncharacterized protein DUF2756 [Ureibacillus acetophenoni]